MKLSRIILPLLALSVFAGAHAHAQSEKWLTEESIRAYMNESETLHTKPYEQYLAFIKKTTHDDYKAKLTTTIHKVKEAPIEFPMTLDKKALIETAREGYDSAQGATIKQTINEIAISPDKKSATVKSTLMIMNQKISMEDNMQSTLADMKSICVDEIVYTPMVGIQTLNSDYINDMTIKQEQEL